jgi:regulation of enolase protein 1 (concanavalin A-like superfamily)
MVVATEPIQEIMRRDGSENGARVRGSTNAAPTQPAILDQLPPSLITSPGVIAGCAVFVLLYGIVFFAIMTQEKERRHLEMAQAELNPPHFEPSPWPKPTTSSGVENPRPKSDAVESKGQTAATKAAPTAATAPSPKPSPPVAAPKPAMGQAPKPAPPKPATGQAPKAAPPKPAPQPTAVASLTKPANTKPSIAPPKPAPKAGPAPKPTPVPTPAVQRTFAGLGPLIDPLHDTKLQVDPNGLTLTIPGSIHLLSPELKLRTAPRSLAEIEGDFSMQVKVAGNIRPGNMPLDKLPISFQGAGLLLWQDTNNFIRFERAVLSSTEIAMTHQVMFESCREGMPGTHMDRRIPDHPVYLRIDRRADEINCLYSSDRKTWISLRRLNLPLPPKVSVGISASNVSPRPLPARFEEFSLVKGPG